MDEENIESSPLHKIIELCAKGFTTIDGAWYTAVEDVYGPEAALELDSRAWEVFAGRHAKRVIETYGLTGNDIRTLMEALELDPFNSVLKPQSRLVKADHGIMRFTDCPPQRARVRSGRGEHPCKPVGLVWMSKYAEAVNPEIKVSCIVCPPDFHPPDCWCEWEFKL